MTSLEATRKFCTINKQIDPPVFWLPTGDTNFAFFSGAGVFEAEPAGLFFLPLSVYMQRRLAG